MTLTRTQAGKTPKKTTHPGYVETPGTFRKSRSRKSGVSAVKDEESDVQELSSGLEDEVIEDKKATAPLKRKPAKLSNGEVPNGTVNGQTNGHAKAHSLDADSNVHGGEKSKDPKVDYSGHFEFGGSAGVSAMMVGFPLLMYYMWIGATYYNGKLPMPKENESTLDFWRNMGRLIYIGAYPSLKAWAMYWTFLVFEALCYVCLPGVWVKGKPLPHEGGKRLDYYCSGMWSWWTTIIIALSLHFTGIFKLYNIIDEFGPIMSVAIISGFVVSIIAYVSAIYRGKQHRMSGQLIYDFFMGAELNPRMFGILDFKMFFEVRLPWYMLFLLSLGTAARQYEQYGYVSSQVGLLLLAHFLYANACSKGEECIVPTWDMYYEKWGFMLIFWNLAGVPLSYCHCTIYLANHPPSEYAWNKYAMAALYVTYLFVYWIWDTANSQKNKFRQAEQGTDSTRKAFPQLPWQSIRNPKVIRSDDGGTVFADGWYSYARKIHYTCDFFFANSWALVTGFSSPFPWFYPLFFTAMIIHRAIRDIEKCRKKYGAAWAQYEREVPYLFIPYVF